MRKIYVVNSRCLGGEDVRSGDSNLWNLLVTLPCLLYILLPRPYYYKVYTPSMFTIYTTTTKLPLKGIYSCHYHTITRCTPTLFTLYTTTKTLLIQGIYDATMFILYTMYILIYDDLTITRFILLPRPYHYKGYTPTMILILQGKTIYQERICPGNRI